MNKVYKHMAVMLRTSSFKLLCKISVIMCCSVSGILIAVPRFTNGEEKQPAKCTKNLHDIVDAEKIKNAAYYQLHTKSGCVRVKIGHCTTKKDCKHCNEGVLKDAFLQHAHKVIASYHTKDGNLLALEEFDEAVHDNHKQCQNRLDKNAKLQAARAVIMCNTKIGRALVLLDHYGEYLLMKQWDMKKTQVQDVQRDAYLSENVDLSTLERVEDTCQPSSPQRLKAFVWAMIQYIMGL